MNDPKIIYLAVTNSLTYDQRMSRICYTLHESGYRVNLIGINRTTPLPDRPYRQIRLTSWFPKGKLFYLENHIRLFSISYSDEQTCSSPTTWILLYQFGWFPNYEPFHARWMLMSILPR